MRHNAEGTMRRNYAILNGNKLDLYNDDKEPPIIIDLTLYKDAERTSSGDIGSTFKIVPKHHSKETLTFTACDISVCDEWVKDISLAMRGKPKGPAKSVKLCPLCTDNQSNRCDLCASRDDGCSG